MFLVNLSLKYIYEKTYQEHVQYIRNWRWPLPLKILSIVPPANRGTRRMRWEAFWKNVSPRSFFVCLSQVAERRSLCQTVRGVTEPRTKSARKNTILKWWPYCLFQSQSIINSLKTNPTKPYKPYNTPK